MALERAAAEEEAGSTDKVRWLGACQPHRAGGLEQPRSDGAKGSPTCFLLHSQDLCCAMCCCSLAR